MRSLSLVTRIRGRCQFNRTVGSVRLRLRAGAGEKAISDCEALRQKGNNVAQNTNAWLLSDSIPPSGRAIPGWLRSSLLLNSGTLLGLGLLSIAIAIHVVTLRTSGIPGDLYLWFDQAQADGKLLRVQEDHRPANGKSPAKHLYRYQFSFTTADGRLITGSCIASHKLHWANWKQNPRVLVEYSPKRPEYSRIVGATIEESDTLILFGLFLPVIGCVLVASGIWHGRKAIRILKVGLPSKATVTHCFFTKPRAKFEFGIGDASVRRKRAEYSHGIAPIPLIEFQNQIHAEHRAMFDDRGRYRGTPSVRRTMYPMAAIMGAMLATFATLAATGLWFGRPKFLWLTIAAPLGAVVGGLIESQGLFLTRSIVPSKKDDLPPQFQQVLCQLSTLDSPETPKINFQSRLQLHGDSRDSTPRWALFFPQGSKMTAVLIESLGSNTTLKIKSRFQSRMIEEWFESSA